MRTNLFCTNFLNILKGPGHPSKIPGTSQVPPFQTQGRQTFEGGRELFDHHPSHGRPPTPPGGLQTQGVNLCGLFFLPESEVSKRGWRTEGVGARKSFICRRFRPLSVYPFSYAPLGEGGHISGELFGLFSGVCLSPTPSRQPLFETSD